MQNIDKILKHLWDEIHPGGSGESNLNDIWLMAETLRINYVDQIPKGVLNRDVGLGIVEYIDENIFRDAPNHKINHVMRNLSLEDFSERMKRVAKDLQLKGYLHGGVAKILCVAFYTWFGCIFVAKLTRTEGSEGEQYTEKMRLENYNWIKGIWEDALSHGNPWIKYGVELSKLLEEKRKKNDPSKVIVDDWIPDNSPYWENYHEIERDQS